MKNTIDLSKIKVKELPTKSITANFDGEKKKFTIRALNDGEKLNLLALISNSKDVQRIRNLYVYLLTCGLDIEQQIAAAIFENANAEAVRVGDAVYELSQIFDEAKVAEAADAEKNSLPETEVKP